MSTVALGSSATTAAVVNAGNRMQRGARRQRDVQGHEQAVDVEQRQEVQQHVIRREAPAILEGQGIRGQIAVREHGSLRAPGRARGVDDRREVGFGALDLGAGRRLCCGARRERPALPCGPERHDVRHAVPLRHGQQRLEPVRRAHDYARARASAM